LAEASLLFQEGPLKARVPWVYVAFRFVVILAKSYSGLRFSQGDFIQEANVALMKAVKRFNQ